MISGQFAAGWEDGSFGVSFSTGRIQDGCFRRTEGHQPVCGCLPASGEVSQ